MTDRLSNQMGDGTDAVREFVRRALVTGTAVTMPLIVTLIVLGFVVDFVSQQLDPVVGFVTATIGFAPASDFVLKLAAVVSLVSLVFLIGVAAEYRSSASDLGLLLETVLSRIPGVGSLYRSLDEMSELLLDSDTDSFQEVKLVEFPVEGSYSIAFLTAETPDVVADAAAEKGMVTLFLPMAPNPVMGGYVLHVAEHRVRDIDMTVEEGVQSIVSSGVATGNREQRDLPEDMSVRINRRLDAANIVAHVEDIEQYAADASAKIEETARETMPSADAITERDAAENGENDERE
ncbi:DUF502 domain-containing protein [Halomicroarcula sp. GCM10025324]|uniref:DUF502 domain-containing protein n=1 Tax=Haloarcula TaxID=2237 RepID=UPI0023E80520|nr:DUF502 domain-containing protein [Halomicroarcula sp. ZS-22-S1]